jgi:hypothetical protein
MRIIALRSLAMIVNARVQARLGAIDVRRAAIT